MGEGALAISLHCGLAAGENFACGVLLAVNRNGDGDSTGVTVDHIPGMMPGVNAIPDSGWRGL